MLKVPTILMSFSLWLILLLSCNSTDTETLYKIDNDKILPDKYFVKGISNSYREGEKEEFKFYPASTNKRNSLHLDSLELGYKDFQIRVWLGHNMAFIKHIVVIKRTNKKWDGQLIVMTHTSTQTKANVEIKSVFPKTGWTSLLTKLNELDLFTLQDSDSLPGYDGLGGTDGISYEFEIATPTKYRIYVYGALEGYQDKYPQVKKVQQISELLETEFGFTINR